jgi:folate-binding protein YgfZ
MSQTRESSSDAYPILLAGGVVDWTSRGRIAVKGADRQTFLHAFCTNDIKRLRPGGVCEAFFCQANGKILGHGFVECEAQRLVIDTVADQVAPLMRHLDRYIIREDVQLSDATGEQQAWVFLGRAGEYLRDLLAASPAIGEARQDNSNSSAPSALPSDPLPFEWAGVQGHLRTCPWDATGKSALLTFPPRTDATVLESLSEQVRNRATAAGVESATAALMTTRLDEAGRELWRVLAGVPLYGIDITSDNLPQEVGRNAATISFNKGCYLGQEPVARIDALGHVNWELVRIAVSGTLAGVESGNAWTRGANIMIQDKPALRLATLASLPSLRLLVGLAYVRRDQRRLARPQLSCPVSEGVLITANGDVLINPEILKS